jgi:hypothetical protein
MGTDIPIKQIYTKNNLKTTGMAEVSLISIINKFRIISLNGK